MAGKNEAVLLVATIVLATISGFCSAATITVGGNTGWTVPSSASFYSNWATRQTFRVGDVLVFNFPAGAHTVAEVNRRNYDACSTANTIGAVQTTSPANVTLTSAGTHYFICTIPGHCTANQKLSVVVVGSSSTAPASSPTPSSGATSPATSPTGGATSPATSPSASPSGSTTVTPAADVPTAPAPSFATSTSVGLLSLVSLGVAALMC